MMYTVYYGDGGSGCTHQGHCTAGGGGGSGYVIPIPIKQESQWISVKDKLPDTLEDVLVFERWRGRVFVGCFDGEEWDVYGFPAQEVTHWMPLPAPPKEEEKNENHR